MGAFVVSGSRASSAGFSKGVVDEDVLSGPLVAGASTFFDDFFLRKDTILLA